MGVLFILLDFFYKSLLKGYEIYSEHLIMKVIDNSLAYFILHSDHVSKYIGYKSNEMRIPRNNFYRMFIIYTYKSQIN